MAVTRGAFVTVGQIAFYEQVKQLLLASGYFQDNVVTHFSSSFAAGESTKSKRGDFSLNRRVFQAQRRLY